MAKGKKEKNEQPAKVSYFFSKGYTDLKNTIIEAWKMNFSYGKEKLNSMKEKGLFSFSGATDLISALSVLIFGTIITAITSVIHTVILSIFFLAIYVIFIALSLIDRLYGVINKLGTACPYPDCQATFFIPYYRCPQCGFIHTNLTPSKYGIWKRTCQCGYKMPTTFLNGRGKLDAYCPVCGRPLLGNTASRQYAFPVIGGPSVGKTCFINMSIDQLIEGVAKERGWEVKFISESEQKNHELVMHSMEEGIRPLKTESDSLTAFQLILTLPNEKIGRRIYIYDISGEMFSSSGDIHRNLAYSYANGFIFMIDPLTLRQFVGELGEKVDPEAYGASSKDFDDILNIMLINLEKMFGLKDKDTLKINLAVVINKVDIPTLADKIGEPAVRKYMEENDCVYADARDVVCRSFLETYGAGNFVRTADSKFLKVHYFTCSALGHNEEGKPFKGENVVDPLLWLLQETDSSIQGEGTNDAFVPVTKKRRKWPMILIAIMAVILVLVAAFFFRKGGINLFAPNEIETEQLTEGETEPDSRSENEIETDNEPETETETDNEPEPVTETDNDPATGIELLTEDETELSSENEEDTGGLIIIYS